MRIRVVSGLRLLFSKVLGLGDSSCFGLEALVFQGSRLLGLQGRCSQ